MEKKPIIHLAKTEEHGIHFAFCGKKFKSIKTSTITPNYDEATCKRCRSAAEEMKSNVTLVEVLEEPYPNLTQPVDVRINQQDFWKNHRKLSKTEGAPRIFHISFGKYSFYMNMREVENLKLGIENNLRSVRSVLKVIDKVKEIHSSASSIVSTLECFMSGNHGYDDEDIEEELLTDLDCDFEDLKNAMNEL